MPTVNDGFRAVYVAEVRQERLFVQMIRHSIPD